MASRALAPAHRRFAREYIVTGGNATEAAHRAYPQQLRGSSAGVTGARLLGSARVRELVTRLLDEEGLSDRKLRVILAHYLAMFASKNVLERRLGLKALDMAFRLRGAYAPTKVQVDVFAGKSAQELEHFALHGRWPDPTETACEIASGSPREEES